MMISRFLLASLLCMALCPLSGQEASYSPAGPFTAVITGEPPFMGVYTMPMTPEKARLLGLGNPYGTYVKAVIPGTAADRAGLQALDYIFGVDQYRAGEAQPMGVILKRYRPGDRAALHFYRKGKAERTYIVFGVRSDARKLETSPCEDPFLGVSSTGQRPAHGGVKVNVVRASTAEQIGLKDNDEVVRVNGCRMTDWDDMTAAINATPVGQPIVVEVKRAGTLREYSGRLMSKCETDRVRSSAAPKPPALNSSGHSIRILTTALSGAQARSIAGPPLKTEAPLEVQGLELEADLEVGQLELAFELGTEGPTVVNIYHSSGRLVYQFDLGWFSGDFEDATNLLRNQDGVYFLEIIQGGRAAHWKIQIDRT
ncbi:PDZ domain-containing protein [Phaeodactylibacter luteus]|nr:PDZ domain-containing protein [Phaeodactylibacter luteus]